MNRHTPSSNDLAATAAKGRADEETEYFGFGCLVEPVDRELPLIVFDNDAFVTAAPIKQTDSRIRIDKTVWSWPRDETFRFSIFLLPFVLFITTRIRSSSEFKL